MEFFFIWIASIVVAYLMAEKQGRDVRWAVVGGILFGWFAPLYYLITKKSFEQQKAIEELLKQQKKDQ